MFDKSQNTTSTTGSFTQGFFKLSSTSEYDISYYISLSIIKINSLWNKIYNYTNELLLKTRNHMPNSIYDFIDLIIQTIRSICIVIGRLILKIIFYFGKKFNLDIISFNK